MKITIMAVLMEERSGVEASRCSKETTAASGAFDLGVHIWQFLQITHSGSEFLCLV